MSDKAYIVYASKRYPCHLEWAERLERLLCGEGVQVLRADLDEGRPLHEYLLKIREENPEVVFDFDMAGFAAGSETGECAYTTLYAKLACILDGIKKEYREPLKGKQSLNMFFYETEESAAAVLREKYPDIPSLICCGDIRQEGAFEKIFEHLRREALVRLGREV